VIVFAMTQRQWRLFGARSLPRLAGSGGDPVNGPLTSSRL
jgi:hypothetical protein